MSHFFMGRIASSSAFYQVTAFIIRKNSVAARCLSLNHKFITLNRRQFFLQSWGEEQQLVFVVLPERKNVGAMLDS